MTKWSWALVRQASTLSFVISFITVHLLEPAMFLHSVSEYALGPYGWVMRFGFVFLGLAFAALAALLPKRRGTVIGVVCLGAACLGLAGVALFDTDAPGKALTLTGFLHQRFANLWSLGAAGAMLAWGWTWRADPGKRWLSWLSLLFGGGLFLLWLLGYVGVWERLGIVSPIEARVFFAFPVIWILLFTSLLRASSTATVAPNAG
jgi:hypothetical protein